jgi:hypothetical protein
MTAVYVPVNDTKYKEIVSKGPSIKFKQSIKFCKSKQINWKEQIALINSNDYPVVVSSSIYHKVGNKLFLLMLVKKHKGEFIFDFPGGYIDFPGVGRRRNGTQIESPNQAIMSEIKEELGIQDQLKVDLFSQYKFLKKTEGFQILNYYIDYSDVYVETYKTKGIHRSTEITENKTSLNDYLKRNSNVDMYRDLNEDLFNTTFIPCIIGKENICGYLWIELEDLLEKENRDRIRTGIKEDFGKKCPILWAIKNNEDNTKDLDHLLGLIISKMIMDEIVELVLGNTPSNVLLLNNNISTLNNNTLLLNNNSNTSNNNISSNVSKYVDYIKEAILPEE